MKLIDQVIDVIRKKHYSIRTEEAYVQWIKRFIYFHGKRHPKDMRETEISQYISYLASVADVAASTQNQVIVRDGKGQIDRITMLSENLTPFLQSHLKRVKIIHEQDLKKGGMGVKSPLDMLQIM